MNIPTPPEIFSDFFSRTAVSGSLKNITRSGRTNMMIRTAAAGSVCPLMNITMVAARLK